MEPCNNHNVYILGAGFSVDAGLPKISNFLEKMREAHPWLIAHQRRDEADAITAVLKFRLDSAGAAYWIEMDLENIEELFSLASAFPDQMGSHVRLAIAATLDFAAATADIKPIQIQINDKGRALMEPWCRPDSDDPSRHLIEPYRLRLARVLGLLKNGKPQGRNTFITFNYDTLLEDSLIALGVPFSYRFSSGEASFRPKANGNDDSSEVSVLKIHGSVNWAWHAEKRITRVYPSYAVLRGKKLVPQLIPPTWKKSYQRQFSTVMEAAASLLQSATRVVVIGFSMPATDVHFKYLLAAGFARNISLRKVWFINPDAEELKKRAHAHFKTKYISDGRVVFEAKTFAQMASEYGLLAEMDRKGSKEGIYSIYS